MQISRLFETVYLLLDRKHMTAEELAEQFEVSRRTIYRDIETLCQAGIPVCTEKGRNGGISLPEKFILNKSVLSEKEQKNILSALRGLEATNYPEAGEIYSKLNSLFGAKNTDWIEVDFSDWSTSRKTLFLQIKNAILDRKVLRFEYYSTIGQKTTRSVEPLKLFFKEKAWYLFAFCRLKQEIRMFKITRIKAAETLDDTFERELSVETADFDPNTSQEGFVTLKLRIDPSQAYRVYDEYEETEISIGEDGFFLVTPRYIEGDWICGHILSYGENAEVLDPPAIREIIKKRAAKIAAVYERSH